MQITYTIRIDEDLLKLVQEKANEERRSVNQTFNVIIEEYFKEQEKKN